VLLLLAALPLQAGAVTSAPTSPSVSHGSAHAGWGTDLSLAVPTTSPHFLYVDDGGLTQNSLSGYQITRQGLVPTPGSPYPTGGHAGRANSITNDIATTTANGWCLFHTELQPGRYNAGQAESFTVDPVTGALAEVSMLIVGTGSSFPTDIHASADGTQVYVTLWGPPSFLDVLTVGSGPNDSCPIPACA